MSRIVLILLALLMLPSVASAQFTIPYTFSPNTRALSAQVNANFDVLSNALDRRNGTMTGQLTVQNVVPDADGTRDLGSLAVGFANIYADAASIDAISGATATLTGDVSTGGNIALTKVAQPTISFSFDGWLSSDQDLFIEADDDDNDVGEVIVFQSGGSNIAQINSTGAISERGRTTPFGDWEDIPYNAANFTATSGTWTVESGDQLELSYMLVGNTMFIRFNLTASAISGATSEIRIALPAGYQAVGYSFGPIGRYTSDSSPSGTLTRVWADPGETFISFAAFSGNMTSGAQTNFSLHGVTVLEVEETP